MLPTSSPPWTAGSRRRNRAGIRDKLRQIPDLYYRSDAPFADFEEADPAGAEEDFEPDPGQGAGPALLGLG